MTKILYRILILIFFALLALPLYAITINLLIKMGVFPVETLNSMIGSDITHKAIMAWMFSLPIGIGSLFIQNKVKLFLAICPLVAPSLFAIIYVMNL